MNNLNFPIFGTKGQAYKKFDLNDFASRQEYFEYKAGKEIKALREYLKENSFVAYLLGKKSSGKGTYSKMFAEAVDKGRIAHFSIGDMIRSFDGALKDPAKKQELVDFLHKNYRGYMSVEKIMEALEGRSTKVLLPSELILALAKREIAKLGKKAIFIDGFPRDLDQVSYSLFFRDLIGYRDDPDAFVLIDVPNAVIDERVKFRVICPKCNTSRNVKLLPTKYIEHEAGKFYLLCDNPACEGAGKARMVTKEGDEQGIGPIKARLEKDGMLIEQAMNLQGIPKVLLRNSIPVSEVLNNFDDYEITPEYQYAFADGKIQTTEKPWEVLDDEGTPVNSLTPAPVVVSLIKQLAQVLEL